MIALVDCNNFFASCERVFNPSLQNKPVVILSNNDGCIIARSNEAKALGIAMGVPLYQVRELLERENVAVFSSNYNLYGDMSRRVMCLLSEFTPDLVPYSIDEAFLDFTGVCTEDRFWDYGRRIVETVERGTGIPITIGIAPTKTLAKVAGYFGKKYPGYGSVCLIDSDAKRIKALDSCPIGKVWGIGRHLLVKMEYYGIKTAGDFVRRPESWVRRNFTVTGVRTWKELQGENCIGEDDLPHKKSICTSRSFPDQGVALHAQLEEAVANFTASCCRKLRRQHVCCRAVTVFAHTSRFRRDMPQSYIYHTRYLPVPTNNVGELISVVVQLLREKYPEGDTYYYKKAGVMVWDITPDEAVQTYLFDSVDRQKQSALAEAVDRINRKNGRDTVRIALQGYDVSWHLKCEYKTCQYTTRLDEIIRVKS